MRDNEPDHLDALIDDTARAMTAATPPVSLRAAVRQRIERPTRTRWNWQAGVATASIVLVALVAGRVWFAMPTEPEMARTIAEEEIATAAPAAVSSGAVAPAIAVAPRAIGVQPVAGKPMPLPVPPPIVIEPIVVEPITAATVEIELIEVPMPLRAEWVEIERLTFE